MIDSTSNAKNATFTPRHEAIVTCAYSDPLPTMYTVHSQINYDGRGSPYITPPIWASLEKVSSASHGLTILNCACAFRAATPTLSEYTSSRVAGSGDKYAWDDLRMRKNHAQCVRLGRSARCIIYTCSLIYVVWWTVAHFFCLVCWLLDQNKRAHTPRALHCHLCFAIRCIRHTRYAKLIAGRGH